MHHYASGLTCATTGCSLFCALFYGIVISQGDNCDMVQKLLCIKNFYVSIFRLFVGDEVCDPVDPDTGES